MKALNTIQIFCKIGKIFSRIINILCIVGICGCAAGIAAMLIGTETLKIGGVTLHSILEAQAGISSGTIWAAIAVGIMLCIGEYYVSRMACRYFANELDAGTPFTPSGARELLHLGISVIWVPITAAALAQAAQSVIAHFMQNVEKVSIDCFNSAALGVMLIFVAQLCSYGAELQAQKQQEAFH